MGQGPEDRLGSGGGSNEPGAGPGMLTMNAKSRYAGGARPATMGQGTNRDPGLRCGSRIGTRAGKRASEAKSRQASRTSNDQGRAPDDEEECGSAPSEAAPAASITALRRPAGEATPAAWSSTPSRRGTGRPAPPPQHTLPSPRLGRPTPPLLATRTCRTSRHSHSPQQPSLAPTPAPHSARHPPPQPLPVRRTRCSPWPARLPLGRLAPTTRSLRSSTPLAAAARRRWHG